MSKDGPKHAENYDDDDERPTLNIPCYYNLFLFANTCCTNGKTHCLSHLDQANFN